MSKETILERYRDDSNFPHMNTVVFYRSDALEAMEEYAKQQAIGFSEWLDFNEPKYKLGNTWIVLDFEFDHPPKTSELYELYLKSKEK